MSADQNVPGNETHVRREACVLSWDKLTRAQQQVARTTNNLILDMLRRAKLRRPKRPKNFLEKIGPRLDQERWATSVLIEGRRGTGKTTLMLTLLNAWTWATGRAPGDTEERLKELADEFFTRSTLKRPSEGLVLPLDIIDLHPLPRAAHLPLYLASRLGAMVADLVDPGRFSDPTHGQPAWGPTEPSTLQNAWERFRDAAAYGWDTQARQVGLTRDDYPYAVAHDQRERMDLAHRWSEFCDELVRAVIEHLALRQERVLLLVPLDDADMSARHVVQVLHFLRALQHPSVAFLLTGNSEQFELILREHFLGVLRTPLSQLPMFPADNDQLREGRWHARLARDYYDRVIPEEHRLCIEELSRSERKEMLLDLSRPLKGRWPADTNDDTGPVRLGEHLVHLLETHPCLLDAFPERLRGMIDIEAFLEREDSTCVGLFKRLWRRAADRSSLLGLAAPPEQVEKDPWRVDGRGFRFGTAGITGTCKGITLPRTRQAARLHYRLGDAALTAAWLEPSGNWRAVDASLAAAIGLALDVAETSPRGSCVPGETGRASHDALCYARWQDLWVSPLTVPWPTPSWPSPVDLLRTSKRLDVTEDGPSEDLLFSFITALTRVSLGSDEFQLADVEAIDRIGALVKQSWQVLEPDGSGRVGAGRRWIEQELGLLAAPEYGLDPGVAERMLHAIRACLVPENTSPPRRSGEVTEWGHWKDAAKARRRQRLEALTDESTAETLMARFKAELPAHVWHVEVERIIPSVEDILERVQLDGRNDLAATILSPANLAGYLPSLLPKELNSERIREELFRAVSSWAAGVDTTVPAEVRTFGLLWNLALKMAEQASNDDPGFANFTSLINVVEDGISIQLSRMDLTQEVAPKIIRLLSIEGRSTATVAQLSLPRFEKDEIRTRFKEQPLLDSMLRIASDLAADRAESDPQAPLLGVASGTTWPAVKVNVLYKDERLDLTKDSGIGWPCPNWPALMDWECLIERWNKSYDEIIQISLSMRQGEWQQASVREMDRLALSFAHAAATVALERQLPDALPVVKSWSGIVEAVERLVTEFGQRSRRAKAVAEWYQRLPLMATPEAGLSQDAARELLGAIPELDQKVEDLRKWRGQLLDAADFITDEENPYAALRTAFPDHPWDRLIERIER